MNAYLHNDQKELPLPPQNPVEEGIVAPEEGNKKD